jgi:maleylacetoacetate isomerase
MTVPSATPKAPKLVLYSYWRSSSSYRVRLALAAKHLPYEYVAVSLLDGSQSTPAHLARSPMGTVPCLEIDGCPIVESVAIIELLDELVPSPPLYPRDPFDRAFVRTIVEIVNAGIQPFHNLRTLARVSSDAEQKKAWARSSIEHGFAAIEALLERRARETGVAPRFAFGDSFGAADVFLLPQMYGARRFGVDVARFPRLVAVEATGLLTDAAKSAVPERQPDAPPP